MPSVKDGAPFPFKMVLGIEDALRPAALAGIAAIAESASEIAKKMDSERTFTGNLRGRFVFPV